MRELLTAGAIQLIEHGWVADALTRAGIRQLLSKRLANIAAEGTAHRQATLAFIDSMRSGPIALVPEKANQQHYEVPAELYRWVLGKRRKYSSCYFPDASTTLDAAEEEALRITCERAEIADGMQLLELGCGWGSLTLWMLEKYPTAQVTAVSNSHSQRRYIVEQAEQRGYAQRLQVITADMNDFHPPRRYDRVVSVEMFEHMRNYRELLHRIAQALEPLGKLFVHIFCHREHAYEFESDGASNWMGRYFFSGGIMPSCDIFSHFADDLQVSQQWTWNGNHYRRTAEAWVANIDLHRSELRPILERTYGNRDALVWLQRWRLLFLAGAELFGYQGGDEWLVGHYLLAPSPARTSEQPTR